MPDDASSPPLVLLDALTKSVPGGRILFQDLHLAVPTGAFIAVKGESGAGKSTLLNLIAGLDLADSGRVVIAGQDLERLDDDARTLLRRRRVGFVFQAFHLLPHLTLSQNVALPLLLLGHAPRAAEARAADTLARVGLAGRGNDYPHVFSGGELQRAAIARALVHEPALILADEPTGNLDPDTARRVLDLFAAEIARDGAAVILVTHSDVAASFAGQRLLLSRGGLADAG